jgi:hypothetical protein
MYLYGVLLGQGDNFTFTLQEGVQEEAEAKYETRRE